MTHASRAAVTQEKDKNDKKTQERRQSLKSRKGERPVFEKAHRDGYGNSCGVLFVVGKRRKC